MQNYRTPPRFKNTEWQTIKHRDFTTRLSWQKQGKVRFVVQSASTRHCYETNIDVQIRSPAHYAKHIFIAVSFPTHEHATVIA